MQELKTPKRLIEELNTSEAEQRGDQSSVSVSFAVSLLPHQCKHQMHLHPTCTSDPIVSTCL